MALKLLARDDVRRPQDIADLRALLGTLDAVELERARDAIAQITALGFHRGRDLAATLAPLIEEAE